MQLQHFLVPKFLIKKLMMLNYNFLRIWCCTSTRVTCHYPLMKTFGLEVGFTLMSPSSLSFLVLSSGKNVAHNGEKDIGLTCFAKLENYNNNFNHFQFWMSRGRVDTFVIVINFLNEAWVPMHVTVGLFEVHKNS